MKWLWSLAYKPPLSRGETLPHLRGLRVSLLPGSLQPGFGDPARHRGRDLHRLPQEWLVSDEVGIEIARELGQGRHGRTDRPQSRWDEPVEILEVVVLAVVAISIAWSGYQAARWDGLQAELYGEASTTRVYDYVRTTLVLATVLFLLALSQRLKVPNFRIGVLIVAGA